MNKKLIIVDIDDVLADTTEALRHFVNAQHGTSLLQEHYRIHSSYWGYYETVWSQHDINGDGILDRFHQENSNGSVGISVIPGAIDGLTKLSKKYRLAAISSRTSSQQIETEKWLNTNFGTIFENVQCIDTRRTGIDKGDSCRDLGASYIIDDNIDHCWSSFKESTVPILFGEYGWQGERSDIPKEFVQCINWLKVMEYFDGQS